MKIGRAALVALVSCSYLAYVFRVGQPAFHSSGLGDWIDPYLINGLLEHWFRALTRFRNPASPPMFFPEPSTLGYSHGLVLYAPFYIVARVFLHPFQADTVALMAAIETGILCLYALFRRGFGLGAPTALALTVFFFTSRNVLDDVVGVWTQRASVFLIPPMLLLAVAGYQARTTVAGKGMAAVAGLGAGALFVQDFYTAQLALFFVLAAAAGALLIEVPLVARLRALWREVPLAGWAAAVAVAIVAITTIVQAMGGDVHAGVLRLAIRGWTRPGIAVAICGVVSVAAAGKWGPWDWVAGVAADSWNRWLAVGVAAGLGLFFWIYLPAYRAHQTFPDSEVLRQLKATGASPGSFVAYNSVAPFALIVLMAGLLAVSRDRRARRYALWSCAVSLAVLLMPLRIGPFSLWMMWFRHLPGLSVIRDPKRIIYLNQLAVALFAAWVLRRTESRVGRRAALVAIAAATLWGYGGQRFDYARSNTDFDRWVRAPLTIDSGCRSFYVARANRDYEARGSNLAALYGLDALFVALDHDLPTLNGYSAWGPPDWAMADPATPGYRDEVARWIARSGLSRVCELDLVTRRVTRR